VDDASVRCKPSQRQRTNDRAIDVANHHVCHLVGGDQLIRSELFPHQMVKQAVQQSIQQRELQQITQARQGESSLLKNLHAPYGQSGTARRHGRVQNAEREAVVRPKKQECAAYCCARCAPNHAKHQNVHET